ncbi:MAG: hypothetical protein LUC43_03690, partial [Burkholderiales bacterium]|nr:hypothetical protein [Burkholderiales bacterium]
NGLFVPKRPGFEISENCPNEQSIFADLISECEYKEIEECPKSENQRIYRLFLETMLARIGAIGLIRLWEQARFREMKYIYKPYEHRDEEWLSISERPGNPWHYPLPPKIPGIYLYVTTNWKE